MSLVINHNMMAMRTANALDAQYGQLATSTQRLSTGLRINSAADDAAGLAIRELQRADIATLHQGARNANDAVSMIQTADGALAIIDEKLIRMKELAEQAATGTYDSTQRLIIDSEFQQMASEINRIAYATDFNGIHLLDGSLSGPHDGSGLSSKGSMKIHFGSGNDSAEDYYYINMGSATIPSLFDLKVETKTVTKTEIIPAIPPSDLAGGKIVGDKFILSNPGTIAGDGDLKWAAGFDRYILPNGLKNVVIKTQNTKDTYFHKPHVILFSSDGTQLTGYKPDDNIMSIKSRIEKGKVWFNNMDDATLLATGIGHGFNNDAVIDHSMAIKDNGSTVSHHGTTVQLLTDQNEDPNLEEVVKINEITHDLVFIIGGHVNPDDGCNCYKVEITCDLPDDPSIIYGRPEQIITTTITETTGDPFDITTQEKAQEMLPRIDAAIVKKDSIRAHLGAMQNRLENTITNLNTQAENLQAAESRISDVDIATEMTEFVRRQILAQSATAMLAQANSLPQMAMQIIGGQG